MLQHKLDAIAAQQAYAAELHEPLTVPEIARNMATNAGIKDVDRFLFVAKCESDWDTKAKSKFYYKGEPEQSYGLFQIHLTAHKDVTYKEAIDPIFSIQWAIDHWSEAPKHWKTCYATYQHPLTDPS